jgi:AMP-polyphosphate phosphotransferase
MLEKVDLSARLSREDYDKAIPGLRLKLGELQRTAKDLEIPAIIVFEGWGASGKGELMNRLLLALDPRGFRVYATEEPNDLEKSRPFFWRFWQETPAKGRMSILSRSWYSHPIYQKFIGNLKKKDLDRLYDEANSFEKVLADSGCLIIKLFLDISKKEQKARFEKLEASPDLAWTISESDREEHKKYNKYRKALDAMLDTTDTPYAPWTVIESDDRRYAAVKIFNTVMSALESRISEAQAAAGKKKVVKLGPPKTTSGGQWLKGVDLSRAISEEEYKVFLKAYESRMNILQHRVYRSGVPVIIAFEGPDAAGKGGGIKRLADSMDPRGYEVEPTSAPNDVELSHNYLWRFWRVMPRSGRVAIFDRSWYGRVLVERVEGLCTPEEWTRAYGEINDMEKQLSDFGAVIVKLLLYIDRDEQLRRFESRETDPYKKYKLTDEDWRNREKWGRYNAAFEDMLQKTNTSYAPWTIVESNDKYYSRIKILKTVTDAIENQL